MAVVNLTDTLIRKSLPPEHGRIELWDATVRGLGLRITPAGVRSWFVRYRTPAGQRRFKLGEYPSLSLKEARKDARALLAEIDKGKDPQREKVIARTASAPVTVKEAVTRYLDEVKLKNRSWTETERILNSHVVAKWANWPLEDVRRADIIAKLDAVARRAPYGANGLMRQMRRFFNWAVEKDLLAGSPMAGMKLPHKETTRDRVLTDDELATLWKVWSAMPYPFGPFYKLCLLTAQRRREVANMHWEHIDVADPDGWLWTLPRELTKSDRAHEVPLSPQVVAILEGLPRWPSGRVFTTNDRAPISGFSKAKKRCDELAARLREKDGADPIAPWRLHDLRRTAASGMARLGEPPHVVEKVLNHATGQISGVAAVYNRHAYLDEKRAALESWARHVEALTTGSRGAKVVPLKRPAK